MPGLHDTSCTAPGYIQVQVRGVLYSRDGTVWVFGNRCWPFWADVFIIFLVDCVDRILAIRVVGILQGLCPLFLDSNVCSLANDQPFTVCCVFVDAVQ
jgi:hypothetical protein